MLVGFASKLLDACAMNIEEQKAWRRARLTELMETVKPTRLAEVTGLSAAFLFQMAKGKGKNARNVNDDHVTLIERGTGRAGWFDLPREDFIDHDPKGLISDSPVVHGDGSGLSVMNAPGGKIVNIRQLDVFASMGTGVDIQEHVEVVRMIQVNLPDLRRVLPSFTAPENLVIITGLGDSMRGTFNDGDPIVVDRGVSEVTVEGIYVLERDSEFFIKRLQRQLDGTLMMLSDNPRYPPQHITDDARKSFSIFGRALGVWNFQKF